MVKIIDDCLILFKNIKENKISEYIFLTLEMLKNNKIIEVDIINNKVHTYNVEVFKDFLTKNFLLKKKDYAELIRIFDNFNFVLEKIKRKDITLYYFNPKDTNFIIPVEIIKSSENGVEIDEPLGHEIYIEELIRIDDILIYIKSNKEHKNSKYKDLNDWRKQLSKRYHIEKQFSEKQIITF